MPIQKSTNSFRSFYAFYYGLSDEVKITLAGQNGNQVSKTIQCEPLSKITANRKERYPNYPKAWYQDGKAGLSFEQHKDYALLSIRTFGMDLINQTGKPLKSFINQSFQSLDNSNKQNLIIDLRENNGGDWEPAAITLSYLQTAPFDYYKELSTITKRIPKYSILSRL